MQHDCVDDYICAMEKGRHVSKLDSVGMTASILCAVHCAIVPLIITTLPLLGLQFLANAWVEWGMIFFALVIGFYAIGNSYLNIHRRWLPFILMLGGFAVIIAGHLFITSWKEAIVVPCGGLLIAAAHFFNYRFTGACLTDTGILPHKHRHHLVKL